MNVPVALTSIVRRHSEIESDKEWWQDTTPAKHRRISIVPRAWMVCSTARETEGSDVMSTFRNDILEARNSVRSSVIFSWASARFTLGGY
jgi:hypothetical protein